MTSRILHLFVAVTLPVALGLASCVAGPAVKPVPKWQPPKDVPRYGDWTVNVDDCDMQASSADVSAASDGKLHDGKLIEVKLEFLMPLVHPPMVSMSGLPVPLPLDGSGRTFRTYLDYSPRTVAHMNQPGTFLMVTYQPLNTIQPREVHFDTQGLLGGVAHVAKACR